AYQSQLIAQLQQKVETYENFNQQLMQLWRENNQQDEKLPEDTDINDSILTPKYVYAIDTLIPYEEYTTLKETS
ncbi:8841_t:CDS:2, partial [Ambispora leptoticha]